MLDESLPPDRPGDAGQKHSAENDDEQIHMRRATSLLRLLKSSQDLPHDSGDLKREFLQLTALLRRIDQLASEESVDLEASESAADATYVSTPDVEPNGTSSVFGPEAEDEEDSVEPVATDWWDDTGQRPAASEPEVTAEPEESEPISAEESEALNELDVEPDLEPFQAPGTESESEPEPADVESDTPETENHAEKVNGVVDDHANAPDENLRRWWVTFSGNVSLEKLSSLRERLSDSPFTLETRYDEIADGLIVLRVVTDNRVTMQQIDWIIRELMDTVGLDRDSAILTPQ